jgi:hypothetical protein
MCLQVHVNVVSYQFVVSPVCQFGAQAVLCLVLYSLVVLSVLVCARALVSMVNVIALWSDSIRSRSTLQLTICPKMVAEQNVTSTTLVYSLPLRVTSKVGTDPTLSMCIPLSCIIPITLSPLSSKRCVRFENESIIVGRCTNKPTTNSYRFDYRRP